MDDDPVNSGPRVMAQATRPRPLIVFLAIALLVLLPVAAIAAIEIGGRVAIWWMHDVPGHHYGLYTSHPTLKGILGPLGYNTTGKVTNAQGFQRFDDTAEKPTPGRTRVIAYGGSTTMAFNLPTGPDWPLNVEKFATEGGTPIEMLNAGDVSWSLHHALERSRADLPRFKPAVVIFYEGYNEEENYHLLQAEGFDMPARVKAGDFNLFATTLTKDSWFNRNSILARLFQQDITPWLMKTTGLLAPVPEGETTPDPDILAFFKGELGNALDYWQSQGVHVVYIIQAQGRANSNLVMRRIGYSRAGAEVARAKGALVLDAQEVVTAYKGAPADLFSPTGIHWNEKGSQLMARFVYDKIQAAGGWRPPAS